MSLRDKISSPDGILSATMAVSLLSPLGRSDATSSRTPFRELIRRYRTRIGLSQRELASRLSVSQPSVARWETGECLPDRKAFLATVPDRRMIGTGALDRSVVKEAMSLSPSEWDRLRESYLKECEKVYGDPRRGVIRSLSRTGLKYKVRNRKIVQRPASTSTPRVHRLRATRVLKDALILDRLGRPVSDDLFSRVLSAAREAKSLFILDGLTRESGNLPYGGFRRRVLKAALDLSERYPPGRPGRKKVR